MPFAHERLYVYQKALARFASLARLLPSWSRRHAFVDHLSRAMAAQRGVWHIQEVVHAKELLLRVGQMTARKGYA